MDADFSPIGRSVGRAHKFLRAWGDRELAPLDASVTDYILLFHIGAAPAPGASQTEIARFSDMGGPALVRHLDRMERDGHVAAPPRRRRPPHRPGDRHRRRPGPPRRDRRGHAVAATRSCGPCSTTTSRPSSRRALDKVFAFAFSQLEGTEPPTFAATRSTP